MKPLDRKILEPLLARAMDELDGEWVLVGGSLLVAMGISSRATVDVDIVGLSNPTQTDTLKLMEIATDFGLPVETLNQAASFFLQKIPGYRSHLKSWMKGKKGTLFRPDLLLFVQLKIARLSEHDVSDVIEWIRAEKSTATATELKETRNSIESRLAAEVNFAKKSLLRSILAEL